MGRLVAGKYELKAIVGRGPHGVVWRAEYRDVRQQCAVKVLDARFATDPAVVERFVRERSILSAFLHPACVRVRDLVADDGLALVSEWVPGVALDQRLAQDGPLPPEVAIEIAAFGADVLAAAHGAGVVHGDVKPSNVRLVHGTAGIRLTDCRVARLARATAAGRHRVADPRYAAPEVVRGGAPVPGTDVYGLALVLGESLVGRPLWHDDDFTALEAPTLILPRIDGRLRTIIEACLVPEPQDRPDAAQLAAELRALLTGDGEARHTMTLAAPAESARTVGSPPTGDDRAARRHARSKRRVVAIGAVAVAVAGAVVAGLAIPQGRHSAGSDPAVASTHVVVPQLASASAPPRVPADAGDDSAAGTAAFVRYWFDLLTYATATGDTQPLEAASSPGCRACTAAIESIKAGHRDGRRMRGGEYVVRSAQADSFFDIRRPTLRVVFDRTARFTIDGAGQQVEGLASATFATCQFLLERHAQLWWVLDVQSSDQVADRVA